MSKFVKDQINRLKDNTVPENLHHQAERIKQQSKDLFNLQEDEILHILFRIGYPTKNAKRSYRLAIEKVLCNKSNQVPD